LDLDSDSDDESYSPSESSESDDGDEEQPYERPECIGQTDYLRDELPTDEAYIAAKAVQALDTLSTLGLNIPLLLELVSWGNAACRSNPRIKAACMRCS